MATTKALLRVLGKTLLGLALGLLLLWTIGFIWTWEPSSVLRIGVVLGILGGLVALLVMRRARLAAGLVFTLFYVSLMAFSLLQPMQDRDWPPQEARTARAVIDGDLVTIHDVRDFTWRTEQDYDARWRTDTYDLRKLASMEFLFVPFRDLSVGAHTFVSFAFDDGRHLAISIEARKERGETYQILPALYRRYETIYVVGTERDLVGLRSHVRGDAVHLYPLRSTPEGCRAFLLSMLERLNALHDAPRFYNVVTDTCATGLLHHLNEVREKKMGLSPGVLLPGLADRVVFDEGLIDTTLPLEEARARYLVDPDRVPLDEPDFSRSLRRR